MIVKNEQEAMFIACEMEKRAIRLYQRAAMLVEDQDMKAVVEAFARDETEHLRRFLQMGRELPARPLDEEQLILSACAAQILFPGGLVEASRENALGNEAALIAFARDGEKTAVDCYTAFAAECESCAAREMFRQIAGEESRHLQALEDRLAALKTNIG